MQEEGLVRKSLRKLLKLPGFPRGLAEQAAKSDLELPGGVRKVSLTVLGAREGQKELALIRYKNMRDALVAEAKKGTLTSSEAASFKALEKKAAKRGGAKKLTGTEQHIYRSLLAKKHGAD
jgi:hypothetical protein